MKVNTFLLLTALLIGCKKPENEPFVPKPIDDHELITSITLTFEDNAGVLPTVSASFRDLDGPGGNNPIQFDTIRLSAGATYDVQITLENESVSPVIDVTAEVLEAANEHFICIIPSNVPISVTLTDSDGTFPIGLQSQWLTQMTAMGTVQIKLKHQTNGSKDGTCTPGGTDVEVNFITEIQ